MQMPNYLKDLFSATCSVTCRTKYDLGDHKTHITTTTLSILWIKVKQLLLVVLFFKVAKRTCAVTLVKQFCSKDILALCLWWQNYSYQSTYVAHTFICFPTCHLTINELFSAQHIKENIF